MWDASSFDSASAEPRGHSSAPVCVGTSVLGIVFENGVAIAADTRASYGKMARYKNVSRLYKVNDKTMLGISGDYADFQYLVNHIERKQISLHCTDPNATLSPMALHYWLTAVLYNRRTKMDPLCSQYVIGGISGEEKKPYLATVNKLGVAFAESFITTGIASYLAQASLENMVDSRRKAGVPLTKDDAVKLLRDCIELLYMRDCLGHSEYEIALVTTDGGCEILPPARVSGYWEIAPQIRGYQ